MDFLAVLPGVHRMDKKFWLDFEPVDRIDIGVAFHDADEGAFGGLPGHRRHAFHRARRIGGERRYGEHHVVPRHHEVVDYRRVGCGETVAAGSTCSFVSDAHDAVGDGTLAAHPNYEAKP